jgi:NAD-dependent dihydropyrimidine dehydrogenase PreA subunit
MAYVIAQPCIGVKDTACVTVCPMDCIHPKEDAAALSRPSRFWPFYPARVSG